MQSVANCELQKTIFKRHFTLCLIYIYIIVWRAILKAPMNSRAMKQKKGSLSNKSTGN